MATTATPETHAVAAARAGGEFTAALNGIYTMWYRDVLRYARDRSRILASLAQPVLFLIVFGLGLSLTVAPLTATIMGSADEAHLGAASGVNNAVARIAGLLAVAVLPAVVGLDPSGPPSDLDAGIDRALLLCAGLAVAGSVVSALTIRTGRRVATPTQPTVGAQPCGDPCLREDRAA